MSETKQVIVIRKDLKMRRGKEIAQASHAAMAFLTNPLKTGEFLQLSKVQQEWIDSSFAKVCVQVNSEEQLLGIKERAEIAGLEVHLITDSGLTEFHGVPTNTCLAIGPDYSEKIDKITENLLLY